MDKKIQSKFTINEMKSKAIGGRTVEVTTDHASKIGKKWGFKFFIGCWRVCIDRIKPTPNKLMKIYLTFQLFILGAINFLYSLTFAQTIHQKVLVDSLILDLENNDYQLKISQNKLY